jgi:hypothetical protein
MKKVQRVPDSTSSGPEEDHLHEAETRESWEQPNGSTPPGQPARPIANVAVKKALTPPLVGIVNGQDLLFSPTSEMYQYKIPVKGRSETLQEATIVDGTDVAQGVQIMLICNSSMVAAFQRAGRDGPIIGRFFGIKGGDIMADKAYRVIDVVEVDLQFGELDGLT